MKPMTWGRFTRNIWRINGIALFLMLLLGLGTLLSSLLSNLFSARSHVASTGIPRVPQESGKPELRLGPFQQVGSTSIIRAELSEPSGDSFSIKGGSGQVHNILFVDTQAAKSWWLLPDSEGVILSEHTIAEPGRGMDSPLAKVLCVSNEQDRKSILLVDLKGSRSLSLAEGEVILDEVVYLSDKEARVVYHDLKEYRIAVVHPTDITLISESAFSVQFQPRNKK